MIIENKLCYSQNVFPATGEVVERTAKIAENFNLIKDALAIPETTPFPLGLWLDAKSAANLADSKTIGELERVLKVNNNTVFTINAFPYGSFHSIGVKKNVYLPDWTMRKRVDYTLRVADVLAELLPAGVTGSISTLPGGYREGTGGDDGETRRDGDGKRRRREETETGRQGKCSISNPGGLKAHNSIAQGIALGEAVIAANLREVAEYLAAILAKKNKKIILAVEMEPDCLWESPEQFIEFREEFLLGHPAEEFIGICYDTCHQELLGAKPGEGLELLERSGVPVPKIQLSAAIAREISEHDDLGTAFQELTRFAEGVYLHQTRLISPHSGGVLLKFKDIPSPSEIKRLLDNDAFAKNIACHTKPLRLVSHFHTPIHMNKLSDELTTAKDELSAVLRILSERPINELPHLEIETYTYNVLPSELRKTSLLESMTNEYQWVMEHFDK